MEWIIFIEPRYTQRHWLRRNSSTRPSVFSLGVAHPALGCLLCNWKVLSFHFLIWQPWVCFSLSSQHVHFLVILQLLIVEHQKETTQISKQQNFARAKGNRVWAELTQSSSRRQRLTKMLFVWTKDWSQGIFVHVVHEVLWSQIAQSQLAKANWLLAAVPQRIEATTCLTSAFECP